MNESELVLLKINRPYVPTIQKGKKDVKYKQYIT